eukprot:23792-Hanusia_phi.AAC.1
MMASSPSDFLVRTAGQGGTQAQARRRSEEPAGSKSLIPKHKTQMMASSPTNVDKAHTAALPRPRVYIPPCSTRPRH